MAQDIYIGNGKEKVFEDGNSVVNIGICIDTIDEIPDEFIHHAGNGKTYLNMVVGRRKGGEVDKFGNTHWVKVDTFIPNKNEGSNSEAPAPKKARTRKRAF